MTVDRAQRLAALEPHIDAYVREYRLQRTTFRDRLRQAWMKGVLWSRRPFP
jgi:hypothetical protein